MGHLFWRPFYDALCSREINPGSHWVLVFFSLIWFWPQQSRGAGPYEKSAKLNALLLPRLSHHVTTFSLSRPVVPAAVCWFEEMINEYSFNWQYRRFPIVMALIMLVLQDWVFEAGKARGLNRGPPCITPVDLSESNHDCSMVCWIVISKIKSRSPVLNFASSLLLYLFHSVLHFAWNRSCFHSCSSVDFICAKPAMTNRWQMLSGGYQDHV